MNDVSSSIFHRSCFCFIRMLTVIVIVQRVRFVFFIFSSARASDDMDESGCSEWIVFVT